MQHLIDRLLIPILLGLVAVVAYWVGFLSFFLPLEPVQVPPIAQAEEPRQFKVFWEAWSIIEEGYDGIVPDPKMVTYGAIRGMLEALDDPNTFFNEPTVHQQEEERLQGQHGGVGLEDPASLTLQDGQLTVVAPSEGSPAEREGILPGDAILAINETQASDLSLDEAISLLRGEPGSTVVLTVARADTSQPQVFHLLREEIRTPTVSFQLLEPDVGYVRVSFFGEKTGQETRDALQQLNTAGAQGFVLDLRDNPGGIVSSAVYVASQFISKGVILYQLDGQGQEQVFSALGDGLATQLPLVVLVNGGTASAAEIVAGALQDHERAPLIGNHTFGKGTEQNIHELSDGSSIHVTFAWWLTPDRREIEGQGLIPDLLVSNDEGGEDLQLEQALQTLHAQVYSIPEYG